MNGNGRRRVLIAGGGVAALEAVLALRHLAADRVAVELLAPEPHFWYRPLSVAAPFELGAVTRLELDGLASQLGATFTLASLTGIDEWRHVAHTSKNTQITYDTLLVACGALPFPAIAGALTFRGPADIEVVQHLLEEVTRGNVHSVAFVIPWGAVWSLPAYELALLTATHLKGWAVKDVELTLVTPEVEPLQLFGPAASEAVHALLEEHEVRLRAGACAGEFADGQLELIPEGRISAERVVALPRLQAARIDGLPQTVHGFIPVDSHCRVHGVADVFAAGDITSFTVKQGGIATQQADAAAEAIAAAAGASVKPRAFRPVLRGLLLTGRQPRYLRRELSVQPEHEPVASYEPLWWPPAKIVGHHLAPFLASLAGVEASETHGAPASEAVALEVELDDKALKRMKSSPLTSDEPDERDGGIDELMSTPLVVAPEDTLGEVAERLLASGATAVAVADYGRLVGILTTGDLVRASAMRVHPSEGRVRQWMTAEPVTVPAHSSVVGAALVAREYGIRHLPVVEGERPVGMLYFDETLREAVPIGLGF
ncbi:MAG TPA: CBS domain-containing protein [Gaiellaceae bacterium]|nr:CBS domain-containing protein [Gaiellaceae bacterium]